MLAALPASGQSKRDEDENSNAISQETLEALTTDYFSRGNAYYDKGFYDQAIADYTKAIKFLPVKRRCLFQPGVCPPKRTRWIAARAQTQARSFC